MEAYVRHQHHNFRVGALICSLQTESLAETSAIELSDEHGNKISRSSTAGENQQPPQSNIVQTRILDRLYNTIERFIEQPCILKELQLTTGTADAISHALYRNGLEQRHAVRKDEKCHNKQVDDHTDEVSGGLDCESQDLFLR
jgi:hypothetical protein